MGLTLHGAHMELLGKWGDGISELGGTWHLAICKVLFLRKTRKRETGRQLAASATVTLTESLFLIEFQFPLL